MVMLVMSLIGKCSEAERHTLTFTPRILLHRHIRNKNTPDAAKLHPRIMWNFITEHFTVLNAALLLLLNNLIGNFSIKILLKKTSGLSGSVEH